MKKLIIFLLIVLFALFFTGCSEMDSPEMKESGTVYLENLSGENVHLYINDEVMSPANLFEDGQSRKRLIWTIGDEYTSVTIYAGRDGKVIDSQKFKVKKYDLYDCIFKGTTWTVRLDE